MIEKSEKMSVSSWIVVVFLLVISVGSVGILNKLGGIEEEMTKLNKNYSDVLTRMAANEARDTTQDARITNLEMKFNK